MMCWIVLLIMCLSVLLIMYWSVLLMMDEAKQFRETAPMAPDSTAAGSET